MKTMRGYKYNLTMAAIFAFVIFASARCEGGDIYPEIESNQTLFVNLNIGDCNSWYYGVCDQSYITHLSIFYAREISGNLYFNAQAGHISHPEKADFVGPEYEQSGTINYGTFGLSYKFF